jgi:invasion protein IalB
MRLTNAFLHSVAPLAATLVVSAATAQTPVPKPSPQRPAASAPLPQPSGSALPSHGAAPQSAPPGQAVAPSIAPQRTTATYDDWIVQCDTLAGPPPRRVCEMSQLTQLQVQGKVQPFSRAIVPRPEKDQASVLIIQVPVNVTFSISAKIQSADNDQGIAASFARCVPDGCFANFEMKEDTLKKFRSASSGGKLSFADASGRVIAIPVSFNGFGKAYDALLKE